MNRLFSFVKKGALLAGVTASLFSANDASAQAPRRTLYENFTGWNCGPCAAVNPGLKGWLDKNPSTVIPISYHVWWPGAANDAMYLENTQMSRDRVAYYGVSGVPWVGLNSANQSPSDTASLTRYNKVQLEAVMSPISITMTPEVTGTSGKLTIGIKSTEAISGKVLRVVVVDKFQAYSSAGTNGEKEFRNIARNMLPNAAGTPLTLAANELKEFSFDITLKDTWDLNDIYYVAFVQDDATKEILQANSTLDVPAPPVPTFALTKNPRGLFSAQDANGAFTGTFAVTNFSNNEIPISINMTKTSRTPADWKAETVGAPSTLGAGKTAEFQIKITAGSTIGVGDAQAVVTSSADPSLSYSSQIVTVISKDIQNAEIFGGSTTTDLAQANLTGRTNTYHFITADQFATVGENLQKLKSVVMNFGEAGSPTDGALNALQAASDRGVGILVLGTGYVYDLVNSNNTYLMNLYGVGYNRPIQGGASGTNPFINISGASGDIVSGTFGANRQARLISYYTPGIKALASNAKAIYYHGAIADSTVGVRSEVSDRGRAVFTSVHPSQFTTTAKGKEIITKSLDWIEAFVPKPKPGVVTNIQNNTIDFGNVNIGETKDVVIEISPSNEVAIDVTDVSFFDGQAGTKGFTVKSITLDGNKVSPSDASPVNVVQGKKILVTLSFNAKVAKTETSRFSITALNVNTILADVTANAIVASVGENKVGSNSELSVSVAPNPAVLSSAVNFFVKGSLAQNVKVALFNVLGEQVAVAFDGLAQPGENTASFALKSLPAGHYTVVVSTANGSVSTSLVKGE